MTIRKAHGAMLFYSVSSKKSYNRLYDIVHDFQMRKGKTKVFICLKIKNSNGTIKKKISKSLIDEIAGSIFISRFEH